MTTQICEAVFQDGTFRPVQPISSKLAEGQHVRLVVQVEDADILSLATGVYEGLSDADVKEVENIALDRHDFFGKSA
ncbi:MAG: antitoxin family protein [Abditibacteriaceae bacterium]